MWALYSKAVFIISCALALFSLVKFNAIWPLATFSDIIVLISEPLISTPNASCNSAFKLSAFSIFFRELFPKILLSALDINNLSFSALTAELKASASIAVLLTCLRLAFPFLFLNSLLSKCFSIPWTILISPFTFSATTSKYPDKKAFISFSDLNIKFWVKSSNLVDL